MPKYTYRVSPRMAELGGGYHLRFYMDGEEMGGGVYPADPAAAPEDGVDLWNRLAERRALVFRRFSQNGTELH